MGTKRYFSLLVLLMTVSPLSLAHSLEDAEAQLQERERYVQFVDRPAPVFTLADANGRAMSSADLENKVVVLNFIYTRCKEVCPLHMNLVAQVQDRANEAGLGEEVKFITIATDSEDIAGTRSNMRAYGENFDLDPANWHFLYRGESESAETTRQLAESYGLRFDDVAEGVQAHGVVTHVIDQAGRMRARFHGLKFEPEHLVTYLKVLVEGPGALSNDAWYRLHTYFEDVFG